MTLAIDGREYKSMPVLKYNLFSEILDGAATGRMQSLGWPMFREPQGVIKNIEGEIGFLENNSSNNEFKDFISMMDSFGKVDFRSVSLITPSGVLTQDMYGASYKLELDRITKDGVTYWGTLQFKFIAQKAAIT